MLKPFIEKQGNISFFEAVTAMAFHHFAEQMADYAVLEVGMGGRLDATNAADASVCVVATVDLEHTDVLGHTIAGIAREKVAVLRPHGTLVTMETKQEALDVLRKACAENNAELLLVGKDAKVEKVVCTDKENEYRISTRFGSYSARLKLLGEHQGRNAAAAILAVEALKEPSITKEAVEKGLSEAFIPARLEVMQRSPLVIMDAAHNPAAMSVLAKSLRLFKYNKLILVIGMMADKDIPGTVKEIAPLCSKIIVNKPSVPRAAEAEVVASEARRYCRDVEVVGDVAKSKERALLIASENDLVLFTGSIYMISEARGVNKLRLDQ
jgi:dihydrofolate synthase/folylpolyglutamate synthase